MRFLLDFVYENWKAFLVFSIIGIMGIVLVASKQFGFTVATTISDKNMEIGNLTYEKYDGANLEGSEVINAIKRYQNELPITIYTGESVDTYNGSFKVSNNNRKSEKYIKPSQAYNGSLLRDTNQEVVGMVFAKEGIALTETSYKELLAKILGKDAENSNMNDLINEVTTVITNKDATIQALNQNIESLNSSVSNLQSQNSTLSGKVNTLNSQLNTLNSQLNTANSNYSALSSDVSSGKSSIANALTKKGVSTSSSDSFATMANNIGKIESLSNMKLTIVNYTEKWSKDRIDRVIMENHKLMPGCGQDKDSNGWNRYYKDVKLNTKAEVSQVYLDISDRGGHASYGDVDWWEKSFVYKGADGYCYLRIYADGYWSSEGYAYTSNYIKKIVYYIEY